jgi:hypothetical protein
LIRLPAAHYQLDESMLVLNIRFRKEHPVQAETSILDRELEVYRFGIGSSRIGENEYRESAIRAGES